MAVALKQDRQQIDFLQFINSLLFILSIERFYAFGAVNYANFATELAERIAPRATYARWRAFPRRLLPFSGGHSNSQRNFIKTGAASVLCKSAIMILVINYYLLGRYLCRPN